MASESEHVKYYQQQELKRDKIMQDKLDSQSQRFANYSLVKVIGRFKIFQKEKYTEKDEENGMSYRIDFYIGNHVCNIFTKKDLVIQTLKDINSRMESIF